MTNLDQIDNYLDDMLNHCKKTNKKKFETND